MQINQDYFLSFWFTCIANQNKERQNDDNRNREIVIQAWK